MKKILDITRIIFSSIIVLILLILHFTIGEEVIGISNINNLVILPIAIVTYLLITYDLFIKLFKKLKKGKIFDEVFLTLLATICAFAIGEYVEALAVVVFFQIGERFEDYALNKSRDSIKSLLDLRPDKITLLINGEEIISDPEDAKIGNIFIVKPGERVPIDGIVVKGESSLDYSSMTGESIPLIKKTGDEIISGTINLSSPLEIKVTRDFSNSTTSKIIDLVENATNNKTEPEKFISRFAKIYTPIICALALIFAIIPPLIIGYNDTDVWKTWLKTSATFLVISCPCALVLSVPMAYFVGIGVAGKNKILVKGSNYLELLNKSNTIVFDKTGTITKGNFEVTKISPSNNINKEDLIKYALIGESYSNHPIALAIKKLSTFDDSIKSYIKNYKEIAGQGISLEFQNKHILVGNDKLMKDNNIGFTKSNDIGTIVYLAINDEYSGYFVIKDSIKSNSKQAIEEMNKVNLKNTFMLTGDNKVFAESIAFECNIKNVYSELLPLDKTRILEKIIADSNQNVIFVGDGINDSPSLVIADVGISMGNIGSDAAIEASDIVVMDDDLSRIPIAKKISKSTISIVYQNIIFSLGTKLLMMILSITNSFTNIGLDDSIMWLAIFADVGVTTICLLNAMRLMIKKY